MTTLDTLRERYTEVKARIARAADRAGRAPSGVMLVAVTKYAGIDQVRELYQLGHRDFGENQVQQLLQRAAMFEEWRARQTGHARSSPLPDPPRWHVIGHLQRNKVRKAIEVTRLVHSVDSLRLAEELQAIAVRKDQMVEVLVEVNCSGEESKHGCPVPAAIPLVEQIETMVNVRVRGLMTMAPLSSNPDDARRAFGRCRELYEEVRTLGITEGRFNILSMGMSGDFDIAIEEGANIVRVGSAIFGEPKTPQGAEDDED